MTFHIFFTYPETSSKTLEEIDILFDANIPPWKSNQVKSRFSERVETLSSSTSRMTPTRRALTCPFRGRVSELDFRGFGFHFYYDLTI
jgi:hypothetical protein